MISVNYFVTSAPDGNPSYQVSGDAPPQPRAAVHPSQARSCQVTFPFLKYLKYLDICSFLVIISHWIRATLKKKHSFQIEVRHQIHINSKHICFRMKSVVNSEPFLKPVDPVQFPAYKDYISCPMDLQV